MSVSTNPAPSLSGLIFSFDAGNKKSVGAPPTKNILDQITPRNLYTNSLFNFTSGTENVYIPDVGWVLSAYVDMYNDYNGGSGECCPSPYTYGNSLAVTGSTQYTYAILYKSVNRYTHPNWMYHYEYNGGTYITEYGVHGVGGYGASETHLGDDWYWSRAIFTTNASANLIHTGSWMYQYVTYNRFYVAKVMIVKGDWRNLHPSQWPALNTTGSTPINNLIGISTTASVVNYSESSVMSDKAITLDGVAQYIYTSHNDYTNAWSPNGVDGNSAMTLELIFKSSDSGYIISRPWNGSGQYNYTIQPGSFSLHSNTSGNSVNFTSISTGANVHMVYWMNATQFGVYKNGQVYVAATNHGLTGSGGSVSTNAFGTLIGSLYPYGVGWGGSTGFSVSGDYYIFRMYNRVLTAAEVTQNFNATKGRFGL